MKIRKIYNQILTEQSNKFIAYHGSNNQFDQFDVNRVGNGYDQNGPGFYFTLDQTEADHYGKFVNKYELIINKKVPTTGRINISEIQKIVKMAPKYKETILDWAETEFEGLQTYLKQMREQESQFHALVSTWYDFYKYDSPDWVINMSKLGYDGVIITGDRGYGNIGSKTHIIMYNQNRIKKL